MRSCSCVTCVDDASCPPWLYLAVPGGSPGSVITSYPSLLTLFRARLGGEICEQMFDRVVAQTRAAGLVKDRLTPGHDP